MMRTGEQGPGVSASIAVRTPRRSQQFPGGTGLLTLFPLEVTGKQVERIDFVRMGVGGRLKIAG